MSLNPASKASLQAYYLWLQDRGQKWPASRPASAQQAAVDSAPAVKAVKTRVGFVCATNHPAEQDLLLKMIAAMRLDEARCEHLLAANSIDLLLEEPTIVVVMGQEPDSMPAPRGQWDRLATPGGAIEILHTHHPRELLKTPALKREAWSDLQSVMERLRR
jgi:hypothetical protein